MLKPGGVLALWSYGISHAGAAVDPIVAGLYQGVLRNYWPPERALVESGYAALEFPFSRLPTPDFEIRTDWTADQYLGYLRSWSATRRCQQATGADPVASIEPELRAAWGSARRPVRWPLSLLLTRPSETSSERRREPA